MRVLIEGHTDNVGKEKNNEILSNKRAKSVVSYLVDHGIDKSRLEGKGYGERIPIATNATKAGREKNRRIEVKVLSG